MEQLYGLPASTQSPAPPAVGRKPAGIRTVSRMPGATAGPALSIRTMRVPARFPSGPGGLSVNGLKLSARSAAPVAVWLAPDGGVERPDDVAGPGAAMLPAVAECTGPGGVALAVAVAYGLAARHEPDRVAALDALLHLAATGDLDAPAVGTHVGELTRHGLLTLSRVIGPLRDAVAAGARLTTWRILAAALPPLLAMPKPPPGTPDLLTLAADMAAATGCRIEIPGLAEAAARAGSGRLVTEARRLTRALA